MQITAKILPEKDTSNVDMTLSVSKSKTFDDCKAKFKFGYLDKLPRIERDFHIFGSYLHQVLENFHQDLLDHPEKKEDWDQAAIDAWDAAEDEYGTKMTGIQYKDAMEIWREYQDILKEEGLPNVIAVEPPFYIQLNNKVLLNGFIDRIQIDPDGVLHVIDYKTTKNKKYLKDFFQLITYSYALMLEDESIQRIRTSFSLLRHGFENLTQEFTRDEVMNVAEKFLKYAEAIEEEKIWRPSPQFLCLYCDYLDHCNEGYRYLVSINKVKRKKPLVGISQWGSKR